MTYTIEELKALIEKATPAPWKIDSDGEHGFGGATGDGWSKVWMDLFSTTENGSFSDGDASFITVARTAVPELIEEIELQEKAIATQEKQLTELYSENADFLRNARELLDILKEKWNCRDLSAMTLYLSSFVAGIHTELLKDMPANGIVSAVEFTDIGKFQIDIHKADGKTAGVVIGEMRTVLDSLVRWINNACKTAPGNLEKAVAMELCAEAAELYHRTEPR